MTSVRNVVRVSFQTALLTSVFSLAGAVGSTAWPQSHVVTVNVVMAFGLPLSSLYALSLIVTLASRQEHVVVVTGTTLAGYQQTPLLAGLAGAKAGADQGLLLRPSLAHRGHSGLRPLAKRDLDTDDEDGTEAAGGGDEKGPAGKGRTTPWHVEDKPVDVELGTEDDEADSGFGVRRSETRSTSGSGARARQLQGEAVWQAGPRDRSRSSDRRGSLHVGFA